MSKVTEEKVRQYAEMLRLAITDEEATRYTEHLNAMVDYVQVLDEVDTDGVEPMVHGIDLQNVLRKDEPKKWITQEEALKNAPDKKDGHFRVPAIMD
ncbi:Asp-tRNA(Asn)/Glu-tRNA(Gln) amidotransferase subunit GatC [Cerasibacillus terrae]|uniref:Aspartyl/glutamyl-tRNA(Asn/Gln) amidotransferase subunit C n=1 Tax=Cerasibacillus terrae TaxID=2498845 RepID=A0A5C8NWM8_9BACI|nr:Asp-tRNA(Asn)/Glu-tRNA(Gln) amidotransferase subunit GatC [Cerasibacillus terrae]TXL65676.1 Asp-tRNA(Asn)/Glu-tRNA(Gln) amidotransferase subunit GatC [Cerasibacillus terrae]